MKKSRKKELVDHFFEIEKSISNIYFELMDSKRLSMFKIDLYTAQIEKLVGELKETFANINKEDKKEIMKLKLIAILDVFLSIFAIILTLVNLSAGLLLLLMCSLLSMYSLKHLLKDRSQEEISDEVLTKFSNTISNCQMVLARNLDYHKSESNQLTRPNDKESLYTKANFYITYYIDHSESVCVDKDIIKMMITILQNDLGTEEKDLNKLILMARNISHNSPFSLEPKNDVLMLTRKNKKTK
ncbi:MAG: hypothetical protein IJN03_03345 [Bacilli bacterium]|nr:hypothetical protein [Bacilli bacterium]